ncbi:MAG TPA: TonB-dependent receptor [Steroidobacteraceae bacterium]|nr:TonB-dependent receptor [Steroidobacteraceae bacterium]
MKKLKATAHGSVRPWHVTAAIANLLATGLFSTTTWAQAAGPGIGAGAGGLEEIVVTATRRESNLQTTPVAVTAVDLQEMSEVQPRTLQDLALFVPNFSANKVNGFNAASFAMRGVGNTDIIVYNEAPVAVLIDDFVMPSTETQLLDPFDIRDVEVLRGPQGTLFGKNTTGGAVIVKTKAPVLDETSIETEGGTGSFSEFNVRGALNVPLIANQVAMRIVAAEEREAGWMRNGATDVEQGHTYTGDGSRVGGTDVFTARAKILWQPIDNLRAQFTYEMLTDRSQVPAPVNVTPSADAPGTTSPYFVFPLIGLPGYTGSNPLGAAGIDNRQGDLIDEQNGHRVDANGEHLNVDYTIDPGTFTWVQGYRSQDSELASDYTGVVGPIAPFDANRSDRRKTWQEELRFAAKDIGPWNYVAGLFYQHDNTKFCVAQILGIYDLLGVPAPPGLQPGGYNANPQVLCNEQTEKSAAAYGETNFKFTDVDTFTLGVRVTRDSKDWIGRQQVFVQQLPSPVGAIIPSFTYQQLGGLMSGADFGAYPFGVVTDDHTWTQPTYRFIYSHKFNEDVFGYFNFSHGFKAGGYNDQVGTSGTPITADERRPTDPEKANSYEVGMKSEWWDHRVRLNEALFYVKYIDLIRQVVKPVTNANGQPGEETLFANAAGMNAYGLENELTVRLTDNLTLRVPFSWQHCEYTRFVSGTGAAALDLSGLPVNRCPSSTATIDASYSQPVAGGRVVVDVNDNWVAKNLDTYSIGQAYNQSFTQTYAEARALLGASITYYGPDDRWFVRAYGRNLTNRRYIESAQDVDPLWVWAFYGEPQFFGGEIGYKFGLPK